MAYAPIALTIPQYEDYPNNWLKAYDQGTVTPLSMATDSTGGTLLVKAELDTQGFPITAGDARFIPFIDGDYDLWLFPTSAEADANDTTNAIQFADNLNADPQSSNAVVSGSYTAANKAAAVLLTPVSGKSLFIESDDGGLFRPVFDVASTYSDDSSAYCGTVFIPTGGDGSTAWERDLSDDQSIDPVAFGQTVDGTTDDTTFIQDAFDTGYDINFGKKGVSLCADVRPVSNQKITFSKGSSLKQPDLSGINAGSGIITISGKSNVVIDGAVIDGNDANNQYNVTTYPNSYPWHGIVISSASTDCVVKNAYIYDCAEDTHMTGDQACITIRAGSARCDVYDSRLGASNNNLYLENSHNCKVDNILIEDNTLSEGLAIFNDTTTTSRANGHTITNITFKNCRQGLVINESSGNVIANIVVENWIDAAYAIRWGGNQLTNCYSKTGADTTGTFAVVLSSSDVGTTDVRPEEITLTNVIAEWDGYDALNSNAFQISNEGEFPITLNNCKATNKIARWEANTAYAVGDIVQPTTLDSYYYEIGGGGAGTSGGTEPTWVASTSDGTATWTQATPNSCSGFNVNGSKNVRMIGCVADNMAGSGFKVQEGSENVSFLNCEASDNREYGLVVGDAGGAFVHVSGGRYYNNAQDQSGKQGIFISSGTAVPLNANIVIDQNVDVYDDQAVTTQSMVEPIFAGAHSGSPISTAPSGLPPQRGFWRTGQLVYSTAPTVSGQGWYVWSVYQTTTDATVAAAATVIPVTATTGFSASDTMGVQLTDGYWHWSTVATISAGVSITINDAIPTGKSVASGAKVISHDWNAF